MPLYAYKGIGTSGKAVDGVRDADSPKTLRQVLRRDGVVVTEFHERKGKGVGVGTGKGLKKQVHLGDLFNQVKRADVAAFPRQLATLLRAGIPLSESLSALADQTDHVKLKSVVGDIKT